MDRLSAPSRQPRIDAFEYFTAPAVLHRGGVLPKDSARRGVRYLDDPVSIDDEDRQIDAVDKLLERKSAP
jgi:hypothetical protein